MKRNPANCSSSTLSSSSLSRDKIKNRVENGGQIWIKRTLRKYVCNLTLDQNTAHTHLSLSEGKRKVERVEKDQKSPDHPDRFDEKVQVLSVESLPGRCYWEVEWRGKAEIAVCYRGIKRKGLGDECEFGRNIQSWSMCCTDKCFTVWHNKKNTRLHRDLPRSHRVGVYLDQPAGTLSFYSISDTPDTHTLTHLHTLQFTFTEPLHAGFRIFKNSSVCVCKVE